MSVYQEIETPCFIIDICDIENTYRNFFESIRNVGRKDIIAYSMKANYDYKILDRLKKMVHTLKQIPNLKLIF